MTDAFGTVTASGPGGDFPPKAFLLGLRERTAVLLVHSSLFIFRLRAAFTDVFI